MTIASLLKRTVWVAPMAGGTTTTELVSAAWQAGAFGLLAAGYKTPDAVRDEVRQLRSLGQPVGVNVFTPQPVSDAAAIARYCETLASVAARLGASLGEPRHDDDHFGAKLEMLAQERPDLVTFTFGLPSADDVRPLREAGIAIGLTVTSGSEAETAVALEPDLLIVQSSAAGGHRGSHSLAQKPNEDSLAQLLRDTTNFGVPVVAAGGIVTAEHVRDAIAAGASAVSCGTAFLLADEAGTSAAHRRALRSEDFDRTTVTRAFTGRWARALANTWTEQAADAPAGYPEIHYLTKDLRGKAAAAGDLQWAHLWAGLGWQSIEEGSVASIVAALRVDAR